VPDHHISPKREKIQAATSVQPWCSERRRRAGSGRSRRSCSRQRICAASKRPGQT